MGTAVERPTLSWNRRFPSWSIHIRGTRRGTRRTPFCKHSACLSGEDATKDKVAPNAGRYVSHSKIQRRVTRFQTQEGPRCLCFLTAAADT